MHLHRENIWTESPAAAALHCAQGQQLRLSRHHIPRFPPPVRGSVQLGVSKGLLLISPCFPRGRSLRVPGPSSSPSMPRSWKRQGER